MTHSSSAVQHVLTPLLLFTEWLKEKVEEERGSSNFAQVPEHFLEMSALLLETYAALRPLAPPCVALACFVVLCALTLALRALSHTRARVVPATPLLPDTNPLPHHTKTAPRRTLRTAKRCAGCCRT